MLLVVKTVDGSTVCLVAQNPHEDAVSRSWLSTNDIHWMQLEVDEMTGHGFKNQTSLCVSPKKGQDSFRGRTIQEEYQLCSKEIQSMCNKVNHLHAIRYPYHLS
jgi:hypothetical protein